MENVVKEFMDIIISSTLVLLSIDTTDDGLLSLVSFALVDTSIDTSDIGDSTKPTNAVGSLIIDITTRSSVVLIKNKNDEISRIELNSDEESSFLSAVLLICEKFSSDKFGYTSEELYDKYVLTMHYYIGAFMGVKLRSESNQGPRLYKLHNTELVN
jgi:hypothetical protein